MTAMLNCPGIQNVLLEAKSLVRSALGIPDPWKRFRKFERAIHPDTWTGQPAVLAWARKTVDQFSGSEPPEAFERSQDPSVCRGYELRRKHQAAFSGKRRELADCIRVLIHVPGLISPAALSLFRNLGQGFELLGLPTAYWPEGDPLEPHLHAFRPTLLLSVDHKWYPRTRTVSADDVIILQEYRKRSPLVLGLSSNHFPTEPARLREQLTEARKLRVDFFYSFQCQEAIRRKYLLFFQVGFPVASCEFGANPSVFYPVPNVERDLNYVFLASSNAEKWPRYFEYFDPLLREFPGLILGPGWSRSTTSWLPDHHQKYLYARAKIGLNLHLPFQIAEPTELNERAYNLAACGVPQLMDRPALLSTRLGMTAVFAAATPSEYAELFRYILTQPQEALDRAMLAMEEVFTHHTVAHRADALIEFLQTKVEHN